jgi:serine/threonine protein kinase
LDLGSKYRIVEKIAAGGMGEVYRGAMSTIGGVDKAVALKVVRSEHAEDAEFAELFVEEAKLAMKLSHANVVHSFDVGKIDDRWFIAMEHVRGVDAARLVHACNKNDERVPERFALFIAVEALKGVDYAHRLRADDGQSLGIVHRDISPGNILVSYEGEVKVADFGIAKSTMRGARSNTVKGKIPYMAPEQLRGASVDRRADLYSIGATLYELLSGERIVPDDKSSFERVLAGTIERLGDVAEVDPRLDGIVMKALAVDPADRYATAAQMRQELEAYAMEKGYLLSSSDLAEFVAGLFEEEEPRTGEPEIASKPPTASPRVERELGFDLLLGRELMEVPSTEGFSQFTSRLSAPPPPPVTTEPRPAKRSMLGPIAGVVALLGAGGVVLGVAIGGPEEGTPVRAATSVEPTMVEPPPAPMPIESPRIEATTMEVAPEPEPAPEVRPRERTAMTAMTAERTAERIADPPITGQTGRFSANTDPWSYVYLDGALIGPTPIVNRSVSAGPHRVRFSTPDGVERSVEVEVEAGQHRRVSLDLR